MVNEVGPSTRLVGITVRLSLRSPLNERSTGLDGYGKQKMSR